MYVGACEIKKGVVSQLSVARGSLGSTYFCSLVASHDDSQRAQI
jgi:hypothetical protein